MKEGRSAQVLGSIAFGSLFHFVDPLRTLGPVGIVNNDVDGEKREKDARLRQLRGTSR
jgi:hypothetical protein